MKIKLEPELAYSLYCGEPDDCYELVKAQYYGQWRWGVNYRVIIKDLATGKFFAAICQEQIGDNFYNSFDEESSPIEFVEVVPVEVTTTKYKEATDD
jgi:hypothetical protein